MRAFDMRAAIAADAGPTRALHDAWQRSDAYRGAVRAFADMPDDDAEAVATRAETLLADGDWAGRLIAPAIATLRAHPWAQPPLRVHRDRARTSAILFDHPLVTISASILSTDAIANAASAETILLPGRLAIVRYHRGGGAMVERWTVRDDVADPRPPVALPDGCVIRQDGRRDAHLVVDARSDVVSVTAAIRAGASRQVREYDRFSGRLRRIASADEGESRIAMLLAVLRLAGRADAVAFDAASRDDAFHLRWTAMREWLAIDARGALPRLKAMADDDPHPEVRAAAAVMVPRAMAALDARCLG